MSAHGCAASARALGSRSANSRAVRGSPMAHLPHRAEPRQSLGQLAEEGAGWGPDVARRVLHPGLERCSPGVFRRAKSSWSSATPEVSLRLWPRSAPGRQLTLLHERYAAGAATRRGDAGASAARRPASSSAGASSSPSAVPRACSGPARLIISPVSCRTASAMSDARRVRSSVPALHRLSEGSCPDMNAQTRNDFLARARPLARASARRPSSTVATSMPPPASRSIPSTRPRGSCWRGSPPATSRTSTAR